MSLAQTKKCLHRQNRGPYISSNASVQEQPQPAPSSITSPAPSSHLHLDIQVFPKSRLLRCNGANTNDFGLGGCRVRALVLAERGVSESRGAAQCPSQTHPALLRDLPPPAWAAGH